MSDTHHKILKDLADGGDGNEYERFVGRISSYKGGAILGGMIGAWVGSSLQMAAEYEQKLLEEDDDDDDDNQAPGAQERTQADPCCENCRKGRSCAGCTEARVRPRRPMGRPPRARRMTVREAAGLGPHARPLDPVDPPDRVENMLQDVLQALSKLDERVGELECRDPEDGEADPLVMEFKSRKSLEAAVNRLNEPPFASVSAMYSGELSRLRGDLMRAEGGLTKEIVSSAFEDLNHRVNNRLRNLGAPESKDPPDPHS